MVVLYLETIDYFQNLILATIISMFIILGNNIPNEFIIYLLLSSQYYGQFVVRKSCRLQDLSTTQDLSFY